MSNVQSVERAIAILKCFENGGQLGLTEISEMVGINKSTAYNLMHTMVENGILEQSKNFKKYSLGMDLFRIASCYKRNFREICLPHMKELSMDIGESVNLVCRSGDSAIYIEIIESPYSKRASISIGQKYPLHCSACGKVLLANLEPELRDALLGDLDLKPFTANTLTDPGQLKEQLEIVRAQGYAVDLEEMDYGLICIAVPIFNPSRVPAAALSISGTAAHMDAGTQQRAVALLNSHANRIMGKML